MDKMIYFTGHYPRKINLIPQVSTFGFMHNKKESVTQVFNSCNFSFVLRGNGWYTYKNQKIRVMAPAILLQIPGEDNNYGPDSTWEEYYVIYNSRYYKLLLDSGLFNPNIPVFPLKNYRDTQEILYNIVTLLNSNRSVFPSDELDLFCYRLICLSPLYSSNKLELNPLKSKVLTLAEMIKDDPLKNYDFNKIAIDMGMAIPTFRKYWFNEMGVSPVRYINNLKIGLSCNLLVNTDLCISEIALETGFKDALYFSRFFKKKTGFCPREYRINYNNF